MSNSESHDEITPDQLRFEAACFALQGLLANPETYRGDMGKTPDFIPRTCYFVVTMADALLAALSEGPA